MEIRTMLPPALPRTASREVPPEETADAPQRPIQHRAPDAFARRAPLFAGEAVPASRPSMPAARHRVALAVPESSPGLASLRTAKRPVVERTVEVAPPKPCPTRLRIALGELVLELSLRGSALHGRVVAESEAARDRILSNLDLLRDSLDRRGIRVAALEVTVGDPAEKPAAPLRPDRRRLVDLLA